MDPMFPGDRAGIAAEMRALDLILASSEIDPLAKISLMARWKELHGYLKKLEPVDMKSALGPIVPKKLPLMVWAEGDQLVIRIGVDVLAYCFEMSAQNQPYLDSVGDFVQEFKVTDRHRFAQGVAAGLQEEEEDGSTALTKVFDEAFTYAVENDMGVMEDGRIATKDMRQFGDET